MAAASKSAATSASARTPVGARSRAFDRAALSERLLAGLAALGLRASLAEPLLAFLALLVKWNAVYNLTAVRDPGQMLTQHLLDSLSIVTPLAERLPQRDGAPTGRVVDVGSGAGLPGIVLALAWPQVEVLLVEPVGKKTAFLRHCQAELALTNLRVAASRVEALSDAQREPVPDLIVCRAFASLADFVVSIDRLAGPASVVAAMKGAWPGDEIAALPCPWAVAAALPLQVPGLDAARHLLLLSRAPRSEQVDPAGRRASGTGPTSYQK
ncbi:MAG: 16S rRNA (guanine(527)-N(7))-methyltransferase RsmG [Burkholderiales bacterium]|nr:MAG: 16S rRNA (guanine(527)-N(7))-methyltransferase RsmG [Burkholderiales bacterium]